MFNIFSSIIVYFFNIILSLILSLFMVQAPVISYTSTGNAGDVIIDIGGSDSIDPGKEEEEIPEYNVFTSYHYSIDSRMMQYMYRSTIGSYGSSGLGINSSDKELIDYEFFFVENDYTISVDGSGSVIYLNNDKVEQEARCILAYCEMANQCGMYLDFQDTELIENEMQNIENIARAAGYDADEYVSMIYGEGVETGDIDYMKRMQALAKKAYNYFLDFYTDPDFYYVEHFFNENMDKYEDRGFYYVAREISFFFVSSELFGGDMWSTRNCADTLRSIFMNNMNINTFYDVADESFGHTIEHLTIYSNNESVGVPEIDEWYNVESRDINDTAVIETAHGCYVVWMINKYIDGWRTDMTSAYSEVMMDERTEEILRTTYIDDSGFETFMESQGFYTVSFNPADNYYYVTGTPK